MQRKDRIRYKQSDFNLNDIEELKELNWSIEKYGCGPTSIANILVNLGYDVDPIYITKRIIFDEEMKFNPTYLREKGINYKGLIYALDRLINEENFDIEYEIVKINFDKPEEQREKIIELVKKGNMAVIHVGPSEFSPYTFSNHGHYLVISDIDENNNFYVINSNEIGDNQIDTTYSYETIIQNMFGRKDSFNFLFVKKINRGFCTSIW